MNFIETIQQWLAGKKTYFLAVAALIGTAVAWAEGTITNIEAIVAAYVELTTIFIRAGIAKTATSNGVVAVVDAMRSTETSEDAYEVEARAHTRLMNTEAMGREQDYYDRQAAKEKEGGITATEALARERQSESAFDVKERAHARVMDAQAKALEFQNLANSEKLRVIQRQAEIVQVVEQVVAKKLQEKDATNPDQD